MRKEEWRMMEGEGRSEEGGMENERWRVKIAEGID